MKLKRCRACKKPFVPSKPLQVACGYECALLIAKNKRVSDDKTTLQHQKRELKAAKLAIKSRSDWMKEAQQSFNKAIRARDKEDGCISCDKPATWHGQWHASHFYATSVRPNLRFNENNVHKACSVCNTHMHGNLIPYREKLILKIGLEQVSILDGLIEPAKYTIQDLMELKAKYARLAKKIDMS